MFARTVRGREFFEQLIREHLDLGRPDRVQLVFGRRVRRNTPSRFATRVIQAGVQPNLHLTYKHSGAKQYFMEDRALRTETAINNPQDFGVGKDLSNWSCLRTLAAAINQRLLETERISQDCLLSAESFARVSEPTTTGTGQHAPGLRFGQPRVMALFAAVRRFAPALNGFRHGDVRPIVQAMLNLPPQAYTARQMSCDLRRLKGLIARVAGRHVSVLTSYERRVAYLMTKLQQRIFNLASLALAPAVDVPAALAKAFQEIDTELECLVANAHLAPAGS